MTDWTRRLLPASFNGLRFYVESADVEAGHRVTTTTIPNGAHVLESFGPHARKFEVSAYLAGLTAPAAAAALLSAAESRHAGVLVLPDSGAASVRLTKVKRSFEKDKLGFVAVEIEAVAEPVLAGLRLSANALSVQLFALAGLLPAALGLFTAAAFRLTGQPSTVLDAALTAAAGPLGDLVALRDSLRLPPAAREAVAPAFTAATVALGSLASAPAAYGAALAQAAIALADAADPAALAETLFSLGPPADAAPAQVSRGTALTIAGNAGHGVALTATVRALALGEALAARTYRDRAEAVTARLQAAAVFDDALARIGRPGLDLARELAAMRGTIAELTARLEADIAPLITVSAGRPLPSLVWAHALYGDPGRAEEMARRARAFHPAFMPERFEAFAA
jgi:prophage DNA circulation protein